MTFGAGGHTKAILEENPKARVVCLDRDPLANINAEKLAKSYRYNYLLRYIKSIFCIGENDIHKSVIFFFTINFRFEYWSSQHECKNLEHGKKFFPKN